MRVVSLVPSVTESLLAWGVQPVACTRFCEQPGIATVGGTKNPDVAAVVRLEPDLVVMDEEENRRQDHDALRQAGIPVHALAIRSVADVAAQLPALAGRLGVDWSLPWPSVAALPAASMMPVAAVVPIWRRPWMVLGQPTYGASLLGRLGVTVVAPPGGGAYPEVSPDELRALGRRARDVARAAGRTVGTEAAGSQVAGRAVEMGAVGSQVAGDSAAAGAVGTLPGGDGQAMGSAARGATVGRKGIGGSGAGAHDVGGPAGRGGIGGRGEVGARGNDGGRHPPAVLLAPSEPYPFGARHAGELAEVAPVRFVDGRDLFWWGVRTAGAAQRLAWLLAEPDAAVGGGRGGGGRRAAGDGEGRGTLAHLA